MAPIQKIQTDALSGRAPRPGTFVTPDVTAPKNAPMQTAPQTGEGRQGKTAPTFNQNPTLKPNPPDNGSTNVIQDQRQPAPKGPRAPLGGNGYGNQQ